MNPLPTMIRFLLLTLCGFLVIQAASASCPCPLPNFTWGNHSYSPALCLCPFNQSMESYPFYPCNCPFYDPNQTISPCPTPCPCPFNTSCNLPPRPVFLTTVQADFTQNVTSGAAPLTVQFTDRSSGRPNTWLWDFGDGSSSNLRNPIHTYTRAGTYTVTLTAGTAYDQGSVHSGISTVIHKENLISVTGSAMTGQVGSGAIPGSSSSSRIGLSAAEIGEFLGQRSFSGTSGQHVSDNSTGRYRGVVTATTILEVGDPAIPTDRSMIKQELLQNRLHPGQGESTVSLLLQQKGP
jgi:hypothetical protein